MKKKKILWYSKSHSKSKKAAALLLNVKSVGGEKSININHQIKKILKKSLDNLNRYKGSI